MNEIRDSMREHYEAFYLMTLSAAFLNSAALGEFESDAGEVLAFVGKAYGLDEEVTGAFSGLILGDMMKIGLVSDYHALNAFEELDDRDRDNLIFYEIKGRAVEEVNRSNRRSYSQANSRLNQEMKTGMKYESFHHAYDATVRFESLKQQAGCGDINSTRQLGILYALGIGTECDLARAVMHLERCVMWGDVPAAALLREVRSRKGDDQGARECEELYRLEKKYLEDGVINLPGEEDVEDAVGERYLCIALIRQYLVIQSRMEEIDIAFLQALSQPGLSHRDKLMLISRYKDSVWKNFICGVEERGCRGLWQQPETMRR